MRLLISLLFVVLLISTVNAQWDYTRVLQPETTASDSFQVPDDDYVFSGIFFDDTVGTHIGNATHNKIYFWVSMDPGKYGWQKLTYDGALYYVDVTSLGITIQSQGTYAWEWWKVFYGAAVKDSVYFNAVFTKIK